MTGWADRPPTDWYLGQPYDRYELSPLRQVICCYWCGADLTGVKFDMIRVRGLNVCVHHDSNTGCPDPA